MTEVKCLNWNFTPYFLNNLCSHYCIRIISNDTISCSIRGEVWSLIEWEVCCTLKQTFFFLLKPATVWCESDTAKSELFPYLVSKQQNKTKLAKPWVLSPTPCKIKKGNELKISMQWKSTLSMSHQISSWYVYSLLTRINRLSIHKLKYNFCYF